MAGEVLPRISYVLRSWKVDLKDVIAFVYGNSLVIALKDDVEVETEDSTVVLKKNITDVRMKDDEHLQMGVIPDDD